MTGAPVPPGADSVIRVEDTDRGLERVSICDARDGGRNVRAKGEDVQPGHTLLRAGTCLSAAQVGVLSSIGAETVRVHRRARVAILATGDEPVPVEEFARVRAGERIVSSNSYSLAAAAVSAAGATPVPLGIAGDSPESIAKALRGAEGCDLVITSGGVSVGGFDFTRTVVEQLGGTLSLWRVQMRPGAPLGFGSLLGVPWFGLPGNPVSALVTFELFVRPFIRALGGHRLPHRRTISVVTDERVQIAAPLTHFFRVLLSDGDDGQLHARLTGAQSSGMLTSMGAADALLIAPPETSEHAAGSVLRAIPLDGDLGGSARFPA
jgi:molybdopterin molybdotransferase